MGFLFGRKNQDSVGVDIGTSAIKIVHLTSNGEGEFEFENFAIARLKRGTIQSANQVIVSKQIAEVLNLAMQKSSIKTRAVSFAIPSFSSFISFVSIPKTYEKELSSKLEIEARKYIPIPLSQVSLGWEILDNGTAGNKSMEMKGESANMKVLLMAVSNDTINKYESISSNARLNLKSIEIESSSLVRCLAGNMKGTSMILDIGSRICNILIVSNGSLRGSRNADIGGGDISEAISRSLDIDYVRSEAMKKELGSQDSQLSGIITPIANRIIQEAKRMLSSYDSKNPTKKVEKIILSGGTSKLKGLNELLQAELGLPLEEGNPWRQIKYNDKYENILQSFKHELSVAIGIAMSNGKS